MRKVVTFLLLSLALASLSTCSILQGVADENGVDSSQLLDTAYRFAGQLSQQAGGYVSDGYMIVAQAAQDGMDAIRGFTDADGKFTIDIPADMQNLDFVLTIVNSAGETLGPIVFDAQTAVNQAVVGISGGQLPDLGDIQIPNNMENGIIEVLNQSTQISSKIASQLYSRTLASGIPAGMTSFGKGADSLISGMPSASNVIDADLDGLIDMFDADDDGDGIIDEFESTETNYASLSGVPDGISINIAFGIGASAEDLGEAFSSDPTVVSNWMASNYIMEFWFTVDTNKQQPVDMVKVLDKPAPSWLSGITQGPQQNPTSWESMNIPYQIMDAEGFDQHPGYQRFKTHTYPNVIPKVGDNFVIQTSYLNKTTGESSLKFYSKMLDYVFVSVPIINQYSPKNGTLIDTAYTNRMGGPSNPIVFDKTGDLVIKFQPPKDDTGSFITNAGDFQIGYSFYIINSNSTDPITGQPRLEQVNGQDVVQSQFGNVPVGWDLNMMRYKMNVASQTPDTSHNYTFTIPDSLLPTQIQVSTPDPNASGTTKYYTAGTYPVYAYAINLQHIIFDCSADIGVMFTRNPELLGN